MSGEATALLGDQMQGSTDGAIDAARGMDDRTERFHIGRVVHDTNDTRGSIHAVSGTSPHPLLGKPTVK